MLGTEATVAREYTRALIRDFANGAEVTLVGSARLAGFAEAELNGAPADGCRDRGRDRALLRRRATAAAPTRSCSPARIIRCCSTASTRLAPWPVTFLDPAPAIARRVVDLIGPPGPDAAAAGADSCSPPAKPPSPALAAALARFGIGP